MNPSAGCVTVNKNSERATSLEEVCRRLDPDQQIITMFAENYTPINCRSSLEGVFHFAYQVSIISNFAGKFRKPVTSSTG